MTDAQVEPISSGDGLAVSNRDVITGTHHSATQENTVNTNSGNSGVQEKMIPQSQVNEIVKAKIAKEREGRESAASHSENKSVTDVNQLVSDKVSDELNKHFQTMQEAQQKETASQQLVKQQEIAAQQLQKAGESLRTKIDEASKKYEDFEDTTKDVPYQSFPGLLNATDAVDNSGDVLYHLGKNPSKLRELASSLQHIVDPSTGQLIDPVTGQPAENQMQTYAMHELAMKEIRQMSQGLRNNESAMNKDRPREPLSQISPSHVSADNGKASISSLRKKWTV